MTLRFKLIIDIVLLNKLNIFFLYVFKMCLSKIKNSSPLLFNNLKNRSTSLIKRVDFSEIDSFLIFLGE
jgi:hypothetical protein